MNVTVKWFNNSIISRTDYYNNSYANGTFFDGQLGAGNTTRWDVWVCSMRLDDGTNMSAWANSTSLTIQNTLPTVTTPVLSSSSGSRLTSDNLTVTFTQSDDDNDQVFNVSDWRKENRSAAVSIITFDTNQTTGSFRNYASSGPLYNGSVEGSTGVWRYNSQLGGGYSSNSTTGANIINLTDINYNHSDFAMEFWIRIDSLESQASNAEVFVEKMGTDNSNGEILCYVDTPDWSNDNDGGSRSTDNMFTCGFQNPSLSTLTDIAAQVVTVGTTYHLAVQLRNSTLEMYVDGSLLRSRAYAYSLPDTTLPLVLGRVDWQWGHGANMTLWDFRFYNQSLSSDLINLHSQKRYSVLPANDTAKGENWSVAATPNDNFGDGTTKYSNTLNIQNTVPTVPTLEQPTHGNITVRDRYVTFNWSDSTDADGDTIYYHLDLYTESACNSGGFNQSGLTQSNFTSNKMLCTQSETNKVYNWTVQACDSTNCSANATRFNFSIQPYITINLSTSKIDFGSMALGEWNDTSDNKPSPFLVENNGNVNASLINITANASLWKDPTAGLGTWYLTMKAANSTEAGSFNWTASTTVYTPITASNQSIISTLDWNSSRNSAELDINVSVPMQEPAGNKSVDILFWFEETPYG